MAWIDGTHEETFVVDAPADEVADFFCDPARFQEAFGEMESGEEIEDGVWHWTLKEKNEKGISFKGEYTVEYQRDAMTVTWTTRSGGNMTSEGRTEVTDLGGGQAEVKYLEKIATDLPIPKLAAKMFRPIVSKNIANGVGDFLTRARSILQSS